MSEFISYLFAILVVGPLQAEVSERLQGVPSADAPPAGPACTSDDAPGLRGRAQEDWAWAAANAIGVGVGAIDPLTLLAGQSERCDRIVSLLGSSGEGEEA